MNGPPRVELHLECGHTFYWANATKERMREMVKAERAFCSVCFVVQPVLAGRIGTVPRAHYVVETALDNLW